MGNGHPLGAVITTREIAQSLEKEGAFFSSTGGSPVSCVAGMPKLGVWDKKLKGLWENEPIPSNVLSGVSWDE